ncbi:dienelactone hydrolase family protein [Marivirga salinae]|uniref:Dienelactone hydrolase family protein n=1 Tax=Marivirga salinarum TaxID=3059078 RepID=A0AA49GCX7_9BACT|nr:dienelactone hydrolase family protein [Marivirga sp. BDSF4-3]WKK78268.1 dienelactone hydrolase family protein [Marivirga sp. BDSF4-3]
MSEALHSFEITEYGGAKLKDAKSAIIMTHGRGDNGDKMKSLAQELNIPSHTAIIYPIAKNNTWYPKGFMEDWDENQPWLDSALQNLASIIKHLNEHGIANENIFILGFSQGACLNLEYTTRNAQKYAGIAVLSGGLIGPHIEKSNYSGDFEGTEIFIGCSNIDHHIPEHRLHESEEVVAPMGAKVDKRVYPGMDHIINEDEIQKVNEMLTSIKNI